MDRRFIGNTGIEVSSFCLGTWMFGHIGNSDAAECEAMVWMAVDAGINFIDTADVYSSGDAERIVGKAIRGRRSEFVVCSKVGYPMAGVAGSGGLSADWIGRSVDASLRRLGTDYLDLYLLHRPDFGVPIEETLQVLDGLILAGKIRAAGSSTFPSWQIVEAQCASTRNQLVPLHCEQPPYSILVRAAERDVFAVTSKYGMGVMAWGPLAGGWLTGKYRRGATPPVGSRASRAGEFGVEDERIGQRYSLSDPANQAKFDALDRLDEVARDAGVPMSALALAFTQAHPAVTSTIIGTRTAAQLGEILESIEVRLSEDILNRIDQIVPPGSVLNDADRGWDPPWLATGMRRRSTGAG